MTRSNLTARKGQSQDLTRGLISQIIRLSSLGSSCLEEWKYEKRQNLQTDFTNMCWCAIPLNPMSPLNHLLYDPDITWNCLSIQRSVYNQLRPLSFYSLWKPEALSTISNSQVLHSYGPPPVFVWRPPRFAMSVDICMSIWVVKLHPFKFLQHMPSPSILSVGKDPLTNHKVFHHPFPLSLAP